VIALDRISPIEEAPLARLAAIFSSDPDFFEITEGRRAWGPDDVARYLADEERMGAEAYAVTSGAGAICGVVTILPRHPREPHPWIGLLVVDAGLRGRGLGTQAADLAEGTLRARGFTTVRLGVHHQTPKARRFWEGRGYRAIPLADGPERKTAEGRPVTVYQKNLGG
jgi:GNAT superfamily N-acetyltransferase